MNKIIICLMFGLMMFTLVTGLTSASDDDYMGKQFMDVPIIETCGDLGAACDVTYTCNITIVNPNQEVIVSNQLMTKNDSFYNFTLIDTDLLGIFKIKTYCGNGTFSGESIDGTLEVTTTGTTTDTLKLIIFLLCGALILYLISIFIKNRVIGFLSGMLFLVAGTYIMIYGFLDLADFYTRSIAGIVIALGGFITITSGLGWLDDLD